MQAPASTSVKYSLPSSAIGNVITATHLAMRVSGVISRLMIGLLQTELFLAGLM